MQRASEDIIAQDRNASCRNMLEVLVQSGNVPVNDGSIILPPKLAAGHTISDTSSHSLSCDLGVTFLS